MDVVHAQAASANSKGSAMTSLKMIAAASLLSAMIATPVFAQGAIQEPGAFAFYHPNADVLNGGARSGSFGAAPSAPYRSYAAAPDVVVPRHVQHHRARHSGR
jgi:hypothetical protein